MAPVGEGTGDSPSSKDAPVPSSADCPETQWDLHIFCDKSERAYGAVAYLRAKKNKIHVSFVFDPE